MQFKQIPVGVKEYFSKIVDLGTLPTLASDSCPFVEKYEIDEEAELLGEVQIFVTLCVGHTYYGARVQV